MGMASFFLVLTYLKIIMTEKCLYLLSLQAGDRSLRFDPPCMHLQGAGSRVEQVGCGRRGAALPTATQVLASLSGSQGPHCLWTLSCPCLLQVACGVEPTASYLSSSPQKALNRKQLVVTLFSHL